ncbi:MAG: alpha-galactosidase [Phycisphaerae bacterium]|nr:alpha-galactosidase [Phycisphaerae bacterium]
MSHRIIRALRVRPGFVTTAGFLLPLVTAVATTNAQAKVTTLASPFFRVSYDGETGRCDISRGSETPFLRQLTASATTAAGERRMTDNRYRHKVDIQPTEGLMGKGQQLIATATDQDGKIDFEFRVTLPDARDAVLIETICRNPSEEHPLRLPRIQPVRAILAEGAGCTWPDVTKILTNGKMYYDAGQVVDFRAGQDARSWWNIGLYRGEGQPGLVVGYVQNDTALGRIFVHYAKNGDASAPADTFSLIAESVYEEPFELAPGASVHSDPVAFLVADDVFSALETYAQTVGDLHHVRLNPIINGWCSWFNAYGSVSEAEVLRNAEFAARHLKGYGFEYVQIDDGFYRAFGDWEGNERFPHGMQWLAAKIRAMGLRPGIWLAPYVIAEGTEVHRQHPDWLVHRANGQLQQIGPGLVQDSEAARNASPKLYSLDITHPDAAEWLRGLFDQVANDWGYDFIKIDFVDWTLLAAERFHDPTVTAAAAYRKGIEIMRQAMGPDRHLLDCGPGAVSVGLIDSMRIELDQPPPTWKQYFLHPASTAPAAAKRYYFHKRTWINDADHIVLERLTLPQAQAATTIVALSGGTVMAGDRLTDLDTPRLDILRRAFPAYGEAARPIDLFESECPEVFALPVRKAFGQWLVLGVFNADENQPKTKHIPLARLGLAPAKRYVAFDFWNQRSVGEIRDALTVTCEPSSVRLLAIHEWRDTPHVISTSRHITQGGIELEDVTWDAATRTLRGVSLGPAGSSHYVFVHLPEARPWVQDHPFYAYDYGQYTLKVIEPHILRIQVRFPESGCVPWNVNLAGFFAGGRPQPEQPAAQQ